MAHTTKQLPTTLVSEMDLAKLSREVKTIDEFLHQAALRKPGQQLVLPRTSVTLEEMARSLGCNLLEDKQRKQLLVDLAAIEKSAPVLHISFASSPNTQFLTKLITWIRREIHPQTLLQIGLQPSIAAGCVLRTPNHYYDMSLRKMLEKQQDLLAKHLQEKL